MSGKVRTMMKLGLFQKKKVWNSVFWKYRTGHLIWSITIHSITVCNYIIEGTKQSRGMGTPYANFSSRESLSGAWFRDKRQMSLASLPVVVLWNSLLWIIRVVCCGGVCHPACWQLRVSLGLFLITPSQSLHATLLLSAIWEIYR